MARDGQAGQQIARQRPRVERPDRDPVRPSADWNAVNWPAARSSFSQGIGTMAGPSATNCVTAPGASRTMNSSPPSGFTSRIAPGAPGSTLARSMTPALANGCVDVWLTTRATIRASSFTGWNTNRNASAVPQIRRRRRRGGRCQTTPWTTPPHAPAFPPTRRPATTTGAPLRSRRTDTGRGPHATCRTTESEKD